MQPTEHPVRRYVRRDPMARLELRPGQLNPYPIYAELRPKAR